MCSIIETVLDYDTAFDKCNRHLNSPCRCDWSSRSNRCNWCAWRQWIEWFGWAIWVTWSTRTSRRSWSDWSHGSPRSSRSYRSSRTSRLIRCFWTPRYVPDWSPGIADKHDLNLKCSCYVWRWRPSLSITNACRRVVLCFQVYHIIAVWDNRWIPERLVLHGNAMAGMDRQDHIVVQQDHAAIGVVDLLDQSGATGRAHGQEMEIK